MSSLTSGRSRRSISRACASASSPRRVPSAGGRDATRARRRLPISTLVRREAGAHVARCASTGRQRRSSRACRPIDTAALTEAAALGRTLGADRLARGRRCDLRLGRGGYQRGARAPRERSRAIVAPLHAAARAAPGAHRRDRRARHVLDRASPALGAHPAQPRAGAGRRARPRQLDPTLGASTPRRFKTTSSRFATGASSCRSRPSSPASSRASCTTRARAGRRSSSSRSRRSRRTTACARCESKKSARCSACSQNFRAASAQRAGADRAQRRDARDDRSAGRRRPNVARSDGRGRARAERRRRSSHVERGRHPLARRTRRAAVDCRSTTRRDCW